MTRIALIHATPVAIPPVADAFARLWPDAEVCNLLEDSLSADLQRAGELDDAMTERFRRLARYVADCGADGILFTCSAFGVPIEAAARDLAPMTVLKPNEAMFAEALNAGERIGMISTFQPSVPSMEREFEMMADAAGSAARLTTVNVDAARTALGAGDVATHNRLVAEAVPQLGVCDAILLAHFSTAQVLDAVRAVTKVPVLAAPDSAVRALQAA